MKRNYLFVDGSNFNAGQYELFGPDKYLDFAEFVKHAEKLLNIKFSKIYFYASYSPIPANPTVKEKNYLKNEGLFYKNVNSIKKLDFFKGYRSKTTGKEKEVDVKLAVDIVDMVHRNKFDCMYLISGDADFMHALKVVERADKKIRIITLQNRIPYRFSYLFKTFIFAIDSKAKNLGLNKRQKVTTFQLKTEELTREI